MSTLRGEAEFAETPARPEVVGRARRALSRRRDSTLRRSLALADCTAILLALTVSVAIAGPEDATAQVLVATLMLPLWVVLFKLYGLYDRDGKRVSHSTVDDIPWLFHALLIGSLFVYALMRVSLHDSLTLRQGGVFVVSAFVLLLIGRASVRAVVSNVLPPARLLFVGGGPMAHLLLEKLARNGGCGLEPIGFVGPASDGAELPHLGEADKLEDVCARFRIDHVMFVAPEIEEEALEDLVRRTQHLNVRIGILPHVVDALGPSVEIDHVQGVTVLGINPPALSSSSWLLKRTMDLVLASTVLVLALPLMAVIGVLVKGTSPGPILFSQERVGRGGRRFRIYKFRTMAMDAEEREAQLLALSKDPGWLLLDADPRVTRVGRVLRHTSLDELPQLWNVLVGDMSLVGPRPMPPNIDDQISGWGRRRLDLTPGITGLWQVLGRTSIPFEEMLKLDYLYVTNWSLWQDVRLLIQTLPAVIRRRGVN